MEADQVSCSPLSTLWTSSIELDQSTEELQYQLVCATMELETAKQVANTQGGLHESRIQQLQHMLEATRKERDEAVQECKRLKEHILSFSNTQIILAKPSLSAAISLSNQINNSYQHSTPSPLTYTSGFPGDDVSQTSFLFPEILNIEKMQTLTSDFSVNSLGEHKSLEDIEESLEEICGDFMVNEEIKIQPEKLNVNTQMQPEERHHIKLDHTLVPLSAESSLGGSSSFPNVSASHSQIAINCQTTDPPPVLRKELQSTSIEALQSQPSVIEGKNIVAFSAERPDVCIHQSQPTFSNNTTLPATSAIKPINKTEELPTLAVHASPFLQSAFPSADRSMFSYSSAFAATYSCPSTIPFMPLCGMYSHNIPLISGIIRCGGTPENIATMSNYSSSDTAKLPTIMYQPRLIMDKIHDKQKNKATPRKRHLPEPPEANIEVMLKSLPKKGKLLEAVMKAGPLLKNLLMMPPLPQWQIPPPKLKSMDIPKVPMSPNSVLMASPNHHTFNGGPLEFPSGFGNNS